MADSEMFKGGARSGGTSGPNKTVGVSGQRNNEMSEQQKQQLHMIKSRDLEMVSGLIDCLIAIYVHTQMK